jgi:hypothetical protein
MIFLSLDILKNGDVIILVWIFHLIPLTNYKLRMKQILVLTVLLFLTIHVFSQVPADYEAPSFLSPADSQKLFIHIGNKNFFKNNEYFNPLNEGLTLPGVIIEPSVIYFPGANTKFEGGASMLKYFGRDDFYQIQPVFRFEYQPAAFFQMVMGSIHGGTRHGLIEPLYQWERTFTHPVENGLQFLFKTSRLNADVWLEWQKFILQNDPFQEELLFGTTLSYKLFSEERNFNLSIPFQTTVNHHGGQINANKVPLRTIANYASGLNFTRKFNESFIRQFDIDGWVVGYNDLSPNKLQDYTQGYGIYALAKIFVSHFSLQPGYYHGEGYMNSQGEPLYFSATIPDNGYIYPIRNMIVSKLIYSKRIQKGVNLAAYFELYKDLKMSNIDYDYGVHIIFDKDFFIAKIK